MKTIYQLFFFLLMMVSSSLFAQEVQPGPAKKFTIENIYIHTGLFLEQSTNPTTADFKSLAPQSVLLNSNFAGYDYYSGYNYYSVNNSFQSSFMGSPMLSLMLGIKVNKKNGQASKANPLLRVGFSYFSGTGLTATLYKSERKNYDKITSVQSGQTVFLDSVTSQRFNMNYSSQQLRLDGSMIFRTDPQKRWSLYAGIGITAGLSINAHTDIYYVKNEKRVAHFGDAGNLESDFVSDSDNGIKETFRNKNNFGASVNVPIGLDYRFGKKAELWKRLHLFYEVRPGINMNSISELRTVTTASLQHGLGLKFSFE